MKDREEASTSAEAPARKTDRTPWRIMATHRRSAGLAVLVAAGAIVLAAITETGSSRAAGASSATTSGSSTALLGQWAACERGHGDSKQADPTVEHAVIYIAVPMGALPNWDPNDATAPCGSYLAAARNAVAGGPPVTHPGAGGSPAPGWGDNAKYVEYANCMRANGYPTFPYPSGRIEPDGNESTDFNGTGIDPDSPAFLNGNANQMCGKEIGAPAWWINNWGPPGSVDVYPAGWNPNSPLPGPRPLPAKPAIAAGARGGPGAKFPPVACGVSETAPKLGRAHQH